MLLQRGKRKKGFTLAELLIIVAIVAVLVAIAIPVFAKQLEKSRRAVDMANARNIIAALSTGINTGDIQFGDQYVPASSSGSDGRSDLFACTAVVVGKTGMQAYVSGDIKVNGNSYDVGGIGHERLTNYLSASGIHNYVIKSKKMSEDGSDGWGFFAVFIYSDGTVRIGSGTNYDDFNAYNDDTFERHANNWKTQSASNIEKDMGLRS